jgi:hypothetical protein
MAEANNYAKDLTGAGLTDGPLAMYCADLGIPRWGCCPQCQCRYVRRQLRVQKHDRRVAQPLNRHVRHELHPDRDSDRQPDWR